MKWTLVRHKLEGMDIVTLRDEFDYLGAHILMSRIYSESVREALEKNGSVEVEIKVLDGVAGDR